MALEVGFFDSIGGDRRYSSDFMMRAFEGYFSEGVFPYFAEEFSIGIYPTGYTVRVFSGKAYLDGHFIHNTSQYDVELPPPPFINSRYDTVILYVDTYKRTGGIGLKVGQEAFSPQKYLPERNEFLLASIRRFAGETKLDMSNIEMFTGTFTTPWVSRQF